MRNIYRRSEARGLAISPAISADTRASSYASRATFTRGYAVPATPRSALPPTSRWPRAQNTGASRNTPSGKMIEYFHSPSYNVTTLLLVSLARERWRGAMPRRSTTTARLRDIAAE